MKETENNENIERCSVCQKKADEVSNLLRLMPGFCVCEKCMQDGVTTVLGKGIDLSNPNLFFNYSKMNETLNNLNEVSANKEELDAKKSDDKELAKEDVKEVIEKENKESEKEEKTRKSPSIIALDSISLESLFGNYTSKKGNLKKDRKKAKIDVAKVYLPHELKAMLDEYIIGQDKAKKILSVAVYNHYKRVLMQQEDAKIKNDIEIEKSNILMLGPTGSGKTYMVKTLAKLLNVPLAITDATTLTEAGYIGDDIESLLSKLLAEANGDVEKAQAGIIFIDEIDKIAKKNSNRNRDVSGESVQQELLKLLEGTNLEVPLNGTQKSPLSPTVSINTDHILFICGGAFSDLESIIKERLGKKSSMGFNANLKDENEEEEDIFSEVDTEDLRKFGMIPEFLGRLPIKLNLKKLNEEALIKVLKEPKNALIKQYEKLFEYDEVKLEFEEEALYEIAKRAIKRGTGARALRAIVEEFMLDIMYEVPKDSNISSVIITKEYIEKKVAPIIKFRG